MHHWGEQGWFINVPFWSAPLFSLILLAALWSLVWKGLALWHSGRRGDAWWFVILLVINTLGILEIIYLFAVAKLKFHELFTKHEHHHG
jgi:methionyl-tRNA synthetase